MSAQTEGIEARAVRRGPGTLAWLLLALAGILVIGAVIALGSAVSFAVFRSECDGCEMAPPGSVVTFDGRVLGTIEQIKRPRIPSDTSRLLILARLSSTSTLAALDTTLVGVLSAGESPGTRFHVRLVKRESVSGIPCAGVLVLASLQHTLPLCMPHQRPLPG